MAADDLTASGAAPSRAAWTAESAAALVARARAWLASPALGELLRELRAPAHVAADVDALLRWSSATLDTRAGAERRDAAGVKWSERWRRALLRAAGDLGLMETFPPTRQTYDAVLILGGATTGNRMRVAMAAELVRAGLQAGELVLLGAERPLGAHELAEEPDSADDGTEWRNLLRYATLELGPLEQATAEGASSGQRGWQDVRLRSAGPTVRLLVAPSAEGARRAGTADAVRFFAQRASPAGADSALIVTSAIYAPYQFFTAAPLLLDRGSGHVELVGTSTSSAGDPALLAQRIAQETHAAISAAHALVAGTA